MEVARSMFLASEALKPLQDIEQIKSVAITLSFMGYISPAPVVVNAFLSGDVSAVPRMFLIIMTLSGSLWIAYGKLSGDDLSGNTGLLGTLFGHVYILLYSITTKQIKFPLVVMGMAYVTNELYMNYVSVERLGTLGAAFSFIFFVAPLEKLRVGLEKKDPRFFNLQICMISLLKAVAWWIYSVLISSPYLFYPNSCGIVISSFSLLGYVWANGLLPHNFPPILALKYLIGAKKDETLEKPTQSSTPQPTTNKNQHGRSKKLKTH